MKTIKKQYAIKKLDGTALLLEDFLYELPNVNKNIWAVLWIHAIPINNNINILEIENEINNANTINFLTTDELVVFTKQFFQILEIFIIGDANVKNLQRHENDDLYYSSCEYVIELFDSSYWFINNP
jgi:hypothetical protein